MNFIKDNSEVWDRLKSSSMIAIKSGEKNEYQQKHCSDNIQDSRITSGEKFCTWT